MLQDFQNISFQTTSVGDVVAALIVAFLCGFMVSLVYRWTYQGSSYAPSFVRSMIFLAMITAVVMLVIGNNLARAFGLVGAMSIIRFRTPLKDPQDIVFVFFALATGMAAGVGMYAIALIGTVGISLAIVLTTKSNYAVVHKQSFVLQLSYDAPQDNGEAAYLQVLNEYYKKHELINVRAVDKGDGLDLTFFVNLHDKEQREALLGALGEVPHVHNVNLYYDTEQL